MEGWGVDVEHESGVEGKDGRVGSRRRARKWSRSEG